MYINDRKADYNMALNTKGKKTSLTEKASIYQKRQDDLSDKERMKNMTGKQKRDFFKTYSPQAARYTCCSRCCFLHRMG